MRIILKQLEIVNFKGIKKMSIAFEKKTQVLGPNACGKTSVYDAFCWVLFGKDSTGAKDFSIRPVNPDGTHRPKAEIQVVATLEVNGTTMVLSKTQREKWTKKRGAETEEYTGNEVITAVNDVPMNVTAYNAQVGQLVNDDLFKTLTNVAAFNEQHWTNRRATLIDIAGEVTDADIIAIEPRIKDVLARAENNLDDYKKKIVARRKKIQDELAGIPSRIDELHRSRPEFNQAELDKVRELCAAHDAGTYPFAKLHLKKAEYQELLAKAGRELRDLRHQEQMAQRDYEHAKAIHESQLAQLAKNIKMIAQGIEDSNKDLDDLREKYRRTVAEKFDPTCPVCKSATMNQASFDEQKQMTLKDLETKANTVKILIENRKKEIENTQAQIDKMPPVSAPKNTPVSDEVFMANWAATPEVKALVAEIKALETAKPETDQALVQRKSELEAMPSQIAAIDARIVELNNANKEGNATVALIERDIMLIDKYWKIKINMVDERLRAIFPGVTFRMFKPLLNGGEEPCCDILVDGVPYQDANHAAQITTGLQIIQVLSLHYGKFVPVFVDNAEAVVSMPEFAELQVIELKVADISEMQINHR